MKRLLKIIIIAFLSICLMAILKSCRPEIKLPIVTTKNVTGITQTSASSGGNVTNNGGAEVTARGVCWGTAEKPTISSSNTTSDGTGNGEFTCNITGLTPHNLYYVRAYATNSEGTAYGNDVPFSTLCQAPSATTSAASNVSPDAATLNGTVNANGASATVIFEYGLTTSYGITVSAKQSPVTGSSNTSVSADINGLTINTVYHYHVKAESCGGTFNGTDQQFTTKCTAPSTPAVGTITQPTCAAATGSVTLNGLPPTGTWTLTRSPGGTATTGTGTSNIISGLAAGTYTFTVTNASGCVSTASGNVVINAQPTKPSAPVVGTITHPSCTVGTGSVILSSLPSTGTWTITRTPGGTTTSGTGASTTVTGLPSGTYTFTVTNASGCTSPASANVVINIQPSAPAAPTVGTITQPTCSVATGSVVLSGLPAGSWTINPGSIAGSGTTSTTISGLTASTYNYTVTNASGCTSPASANVVINANLSTPAAPTAGTITHPTCSVATGSVVLNGLPAGNWTINPGSITGSGLTTTISGLTAGTYNYTVTNASDCTSPASANVVINAQPVKPAAPVVGTITQPTCSVATGSVVLSSLPGSGTWTLTRTPGGTTTSGTGASTTVTGLPSGTYTFTVTNASGCVSTASGNVVINAPPIGLNIYVYSFTGTIAKLTLSVEAVIHATSSILSCSVGFYLSKNTILDQSDILVKELNALFRIGTSTITTSYTFETKPLPGTYYIICAADNKNAVKECDEDDNTKWIRITVQ